MSQICYNNYIMIIEEYVMKKLGFGFMRLPVLDTNDASKVDFDQLCKMVDTFM